MTLSQIISDLCLECVFLDAEISQLKKKKWFKPTNKIQYLENKLSGLLLKKEHLQNLESVLKESELVMKTDSVDNLDEPDLRKLGFYLIERNITENKKWKHVYKI